MAVCQFSQNEKELQTIDTHACRDSTMAGCLTKVPRPAKNWLGNTGRICHSEAPLPARAGEKPTQNSPAGSASLSKL